MRPTSLAVVFLIFFFNGVKSATITLRNNCPYTIWPATLTSKGSPPPTGFELKSQASINVQVDPHWSGRVWARFRCDNSGSKLTCGSADCGTGQIPCNGKGGKPPATLIEFTLLGNNNLDFYEISLVDGFNLPVNVVPAKGGCPTIACPVDISNKGCPDELVVRSSDGGVVGCNSACIKYNAPEYCCTGAYGSPDKCNPTKYSDIFKRNCPQAYTYAYDDRSSLFTCKDGSSGYIITFCP